ncbi:MAG: triose-phosphate isomerase [Gammaproteobacteria bacterium]|nr:triose-phosphate isomerase [Gammaproteobacteria bacterium]
MTATRRTPLIAGNWKMHGSMTKSRELVAELVEGVKGDDGARMLLCPPYVYLRDVSVWLAGSPIALGAQNLSAQTSPGAFTGEVAGTMLTDVGCKYGLVGHSERRTLYGETDKGVATKFLAAQMQGLTPILCVGESLQERQDGRTEAVVRRQIDTVLDAAGVSAFVTAVVAYEPVWAIGTGRTATPDQAQEVHALIRAMIGVRDATIAAGLTILYGGSVTGANARELFAMDDIDGGLVGGASLKAQEFLTIYRAARS